MRPQNGTRTVKGTAPPTECSLDVLLFERALRGDHQAFAKLLKPHERVLFVSAMAILKNEPDAERAAGDAVLKAFGTLTQFRRTANFRNWLVRIVIDEANSMLQDEHELYGFLREPGEETEQPYVPGILDAWRHISPMERKDTELRETLHAALKSLPRKYRAVMALRDIAHLSIGDTADVLGLTAENVKTRLSRARLQIREVLAGKIGLLSKTEKSST
jgi:RNA polymerase sigma-70 factor, ECF subfamily